jgi:hypothetical protein
LFERVEIKSKSEAHWWCQSVNRLCNADVDQEQGDGYVVEKPGTIARESKMTL